MALKDLIEAGVKQAVAPRAEEPAPAVPGMPPAPAADDAGPYKPGDKVTMTAGEHAGMNCTIASHAGKMHCYDATCDDDGPMKGQTIRCCEDQSEPAAAQDAPAARQARQARTETAALRKQLAATTLERDTMRMERAGAASDLAGLLAERYGSDSDKAKASHPSAFMTLATGTAPVKGVKAEPVAEHVTPQATLPAGAALPKPTTPATPSSGRKFDGASRS